MAYWGHQNRLAKARQTVRTIRCCSIIRANARKLVRRHQATIPGAGEQGRPGGLTAALIASLRAFAFYFARRVVSPRWPRGLPCCAVGYLTAPARGKGIAVNLQEFFDRHYAADYDLSPSRERSIRTTLRQFFQLVGPVELADLSQAHVDEFCAHLAAGRRLPHIVDRKRRDILYLWADAYRREFKDTPPKLPAAYLLRYRRTVERPRDEQYRRNSLLRFFDRRFRPEALQHVSKSQTSAYRKAILKLCDYCGADVTIGEVTDSLLTSFVAWAATRMSRKTARDYRSYIRAVVRHAKPGEFCKGKRRYDTATGPNLDDNELNVKGSLYRFWREVYMPRCMVGASPGSAEQILYAIRRLCKYTGHSVLVADLNDNLISGHMQWMVDRGLSRATINSARAAILALWREAYRQELVERLPTVRKLQGHKRLPTAWSVGELERILQAAASLRGRVGQQLAADWWPALILFLYDTGLRIRSALAVQRDGVDLETGWVTVEAQTQKHKVEQRFRLTDQTIEAIRAIWLPPRKKLFYWPGHLREIWRWFGKILRKADLPDTGRHKFHMLRRTCATHLAAVAGVETAAKHLGHSSSDVTDRYIDPRFLAEHDTTRLLPRPRLGKGSTDRDQKGGAI